jgi:hypothetical protein
VLAASLAITPAALAQDFFSAFFGAFGARPPVAPPVAAPFRDGGAPLPYRARRARPSFDSGGQAYCVRRCDGRYFPVTAPDKESQAKVCRDLCPSAETSLVYGSNIDRATTESGKSYSDLPNAFRYRNEVVSGCTCNGKDQIGLASIKIEDDPTLRSGDIVAGSNGLVIANRTSHRRGVALNFSPIPERLRARFRHVPVVARE